MLWIEEIDFHMMSTNLRENSRNVDLGSENRQQNTLDDSGTNHGSHTVKRYVHDPITLRSLQDKQQVMNQPCCQGTTQQCSNAVFTTTLKRTLKISRLPIPVIHMRPLPT